MAEIHNTGQLGEDLAFNYLLKKGYSINARNYRFKRSEVDIIASKDSILVFVEVKARSRLDFGRPEQFVKKNKWRLLVDAANQYMIDNQYEGEIRFDIIAIDLRDTKKPQIRHFEDCYFPTW